MLLQNYPGILEALKQRIEQARIRTAVKVNAELLQLYWEIGKTILEQQESEGWGAKVIDKLSADLCNAFPDFRGLSVRNLKYMRAFAAAYPDFLTIVQTPSAQLPEGSAASIVQMLSAQITWSQHTLLLERVKDPAARLFYMQKIVENSWNVKMLGVHIENNLYDRHGKAISNFKERLPSIHSDLVQETIKNPYIFDFMGFSEKMRERELEKALIQHLKEFMLELGRGFAFVGNQTNLNVDGDDFFLDLLFFNYQLNCFVVIELKVGDFEPEFAGKLNFYVNTVNEKLRNSALHQPTIGVLLCKTPNETVVKYSLQGIESPIGVSTYELGQALPSELEGEIPTVEELEAELEKGMEELKSPSQKRLDALKAQLANLKGEEMKTVATYEIVCSIFDQSIKPMFIALLESLKELEPMFYSNDYWWTGPNNIKDIEQLDKYWKDDDLLRKTSYWDFNYALRGLKQAGVDGFDVYLNVRYQIDTYNYNLAIVNRKNNERFIKKQYHEQFTQEDIQSIVEVCKDWLISQIEEGLERLKK